MDPALGPERGDAHDDCDARHHEPKCPQYGERCDFLIQVRDQDGPKRQERNHCHSEGLG